MMQNGFFSAPYTVVYVLPKNYCTNETQMYHYCSFCDYWLSCSMLSWRLSKKEILEYLKDYKVYGPGIHGNCPRCGCFLDDSPYLKEIRRNFDQ